MSGRKFKVSIGEGKVTPEFIVKENDKIIMECRELISDSTVGSKNVVVFRVVFGPGAEHSKHRHINCDEMVYCISGRGAEGIKENKGEYKEYEYTPGTVMYVPKGVAHYTRNLDYFEPFVCIGIFPGISNMDKNTTGYETMGEISLKDRVLK